ncbi:MAG: response regulator [Pirellulaceae bacterium]|nr:response regulator [Pirellulaceae bacterium]
MKPQILFVDDDANALATYARALRSIASSWECVLEQDPTRAWERIQSEQIDVVVTDVHMPFLSGFELLRLMQKNSKTSDIPVVIVTGNSDVRSKTEAIEMGAADLLTKPVERAELVARVRSSLRVKEFQDRLRTQNQQLEKMVQARTLQLANSQQELVWRLAKAAEFRDELTGNHVLRVGHYSKIIAKKMNLGPEFEENISLAAPLHDIGKIGIADYILFKPGKLTAGEWKQMKKHCELGALILRGHSRTTSLGRKLINCSQLIGSEAFEDQSAPEWKSPLLDMASVIALCHHEKWDGTGYPRQLKGEEIPIEARIVAITDVYDALRSKRPYKEAYSVEQTLAILDKDVGKAFDPAVYEVFIEAFAEIREAEELLADPITKEGEGDHAQHLIC